MNLDLTSMTLVHPAKRDAEFIACMEDVLDVYELTYDPMRPVGLSSMKNHTSCWERQGNRCQCARENDRKVDSEYIRNGTCSIFAFIEPLAGKHHVSVREHRTAVDWAEEIKYLVDVMYPEVEKIILVMDNLNTHQTGILI